MVEYIGQDVDESSNKKPHGNSSKNKNKVYKRRDPKINEIIRSMSGMKPKEIQKYLEDMGLVDSDLTSKSVRQVLYYERLKIKKSTKSDDIKSKAENTNSEIKQWLQNQMPKCDTSLVKICGKI